MLLIDCEKNWNVINGRHLGGIGRFVSGRGLEGGGESCCLFRLSQEALGIRRVGDVMPAAHHILISLNSKVRWCAHGSHCLHQGVHAAEVRVLF